MRQPIYDIYAYVRFADEIVDTFHQFDKSKLLEQFRNDTYTAFDQNISLPLEVKTSQRILNARLKLFNEPSEMN